MPLRSLAPGEGDAYADLLRNTRGLRREHAHAREEWFSHLEVERKGDQLFELEVLLKGLGTFANPRNHPGPTRRTPIAAQDFREPLILVRDSMERIIRLCRSLLVERERAFVFQRYLETVLPDDSARTRLLNGNSQDSPVESLFVLRHSMSNLFEVAGGMVRLPQIPFRLFFRFLGIAQREVVNSVYFNPLSALEFRPEFDRITSAKKRV